MCGIVGAVAERPITSLQSWSVSLYSFCPTMRPW